MPTLQLNITQLDEVAEKSTKRLAEIYAEAGWGQTPPKISAGIVSVIASEIEKALQIKPAQVTRAFKE